MTTALMRGGLAAASMTVAMLTAAQAEPVTTDDLLKAQDNAGEWLMYGRDYRNWRYSPLAEITPDNAAKLTPVWALSTGGQFGGLEATPLFHDGVLYFSADYARVFAVDARSGRVLWRYEPEYEEGSQHHAVLRPDPPRRRAERRSRLSWRGSTPSWWPSMPPTARSCGSRRSTSGRTASRPMPRRSSSRIT